VTAAQITYLVGDATQPGPRPAVIAHIVNDIGAWGAGFVVALARSWPTAKHDYHTWHQHGPDFKLGKTRAVLVSDDTSDDGEVWVANMLAQHGIGRNPDGTPPIRYGALAECPRQASQAAENIGAELHMPRIGCGLAGGTWDRVEPIIRGACGVPVYVYDLPIQWAAG
jgi:O-acetyl-ADP-ribose deacetylase (regulator of RNase III)